MGKTKNKVTIKTPSHGCDIIDLRYHSGSFNISSGRDYDTPPEIDREHKSWASIEFKCERHGSEDVADDFNRLSGNEGDSHVHTYAANRGSGKPKKLNFFFKVTLTLTLGEDDVPCKVDLYLGQGHHDDTNNWWMGGQQVSRNHGATLSVSGRDTSKSWPIRLTGGTSHFTLELL